MTYDDGITDDQSDPPEQGKPAALYLDGDWVADFDTGMMPKEKRDDIGRAIAAVFALAPGLLDTIDRLTHERGAERAELMDAFGEYIDAVEAARKSYHNSTLWYLDGHDDRIEAAAQRLYNLQTPTLPTDRSPK